VIRIPRREKYACETLRSAFWASQIVLFLSLCLSSFAQAQSVTDQRTDLPTVLSTDLSVNRDVDDWYDVFQFVRTRPKQPSAIMLDSYATDEVEELARTFLNILGRPELQIVKGIRETLEAHTCEVDGKCPPCSASPSTRFYHDFLSASKEKARIIAVGSLRNEAAAFLCFPSLFISKIDAIYIVAGRLGGDGSTNFNRDRLAATIIVNSPIPKVWFEKSHQYMPAEIERQFYASGVRSAAFLSQRVEEWRKWRGLAFLEKTRQLPDQGRNMWSIPAFMIASSQPLALDAANGKMELNPRTRRLEFHRYARGADLMLRNVDNDAAERWLAGLLMEEAQRK